MRRHLNPRRGWIVGLAALAVVGCASPRYLAYTAESLRLQVRERLPELPESEIIVPFEIDPKFVKIARKATRYQGTAHDKARALAEALKSPKWFGLEYAWASSGTAAETIEAGHGDCLALSSVYIGLARGIGLPAFYVDASYRPERREEEEVIVSAGHIGVLIPTAENFTLVDFSGEMSKRRFRPIDDLEALAHLYNNRGYEVIHRAQNSGDPVSWEDARSFFQLATQVRPDFARGWNNLGIAEGRLGNLDEAERTYREAIARDPKLSSPHLNLGNLYLERGEPEAALVDLQLAAKLDRRNPFIHYLRGRALLERGTLDDAEKALRRSIRLKKDYPEAQSLLGEVRRQLAQGQRMREAAN